MNEREKILVIRDQLIDDQLSFIDAFEQIKKLPKPWHRKDWKEKRPNFIKSECEQCKSSEGTMVLQHLVHPPEYEDIRKIIFKCLFENFVEDVPTPEIFITVDEINAFHQKTTKERDACPQCEWIRVRKRKTMKPEYFCDECKIAFDEPKKIFYNEVFKKHFPTNEDIIYHLTEEKKNLQRQHLRQEFYNNNIHHIEKQALLISIALHLKYIDMLDVMTFCKRCAARMDVDGKLLCWSCKTNYYSYEDYDCCYHCYQDDNINKNPIKGFILNKRGIQIDFIRSFLNNPPITAEPSSPAPGNTHS